jgi:hypothetical protein
MVAVAALIARPSAAALAMIIFFARIITPL